MNNLLIIDFGTKHLEQIKCMVLGHFSNIDVISEANFVEATGYDFVILSGGSHIPSVVHHPEKHKKVLKFIKTSEVPMLGICFGCELIARAFGCELSDRGIKKFETLEVCFSENRYCLSAFEAHRFSVKHVSGEIEVIAHSKDNPIEAIRHKTKRIIGVQFHPEMSLESASIFEYILSLY